MAGERDVWTRSAPGSRKPRFSRAEIAAVAISIADAEGFEAVSMRRIATELGAGTMTLYHYVRTKDELLEILVDALLGEVVLLDPARLPRDWKAAITMIATRSRDAIRRHPWVLDLAEMPGIGPNALRHMDQSLQALSSLDAPLELKLDLVTAVDEYVYGFCLHERQDAAEAHPREVQEYLVSQVNPREHPALAGLMEELGDELWPRVERHLSATGRFERNIERLLAGFEASVRRR